MDRYIVRCRLAIKHARDLIFEVHEIDPKIVWQSLNEASRWELQAIIVSLASMLPAGKAPDISWLQSLVPREKGDHPHTTAARGLAVLVPEENNEEEGR